MEVWLGKVRFKAFGKMTSPGKGWIMSKEKKEIVMNGILEISLVKGYDV